MIGAMVSHYKILDKLGEGGMGVVFKAQDTKLDRTIALKFLAQSIIVNESNKVRFLQEVKAASAINHPNVCVIHDIQEFDGKEFIVMEYVEGETLGQTIKSRKLSLKDITNYAIQIAEALHEAHSNGIIHRDIKAENIMVNSKNQIKVMDFGLAELKGSIELTKSTSMVGTLAYMAPEQILGTTIDTRSDIFSFGVVLYEMLSGQLPFMADFDSLMMYSIINKQPEPIQKYRTDLSSEYLHILNRALEKDPEDRYQNAHDVAIDLKRVLRDFVRVSKTSISNVSKKESENPDTVTKRAKSHKPIFFIISLICVTIVFVSVAIWFFKTSPQETAGPTKFTKFTSYPGAEMDPAFSSDGNDIAFSWNGNGGNSRNIYVKTVGIGAYNAQQITGSSLDDHAPVWSHDRKFIAFHRVDPIWKHFLYNGPGKICIVRAIGGQVRELDNGWQPSWSPDDQFLFFCDFDTVKQSFCIYKMNIQTLEREKIAQPDSGYHFLNPVLSPKGDKVAYVGSTHWATTYPDELYVTTLVDKKTIKLTEDNVQIQGLTWTPDNHSIVYGSQRGGPFALWKIKASGGEPVYIGVSGNLCFQPAISPDGKYLVYTTSIKPVDESIIYERKINNSGNTSPPTKLIYAIGSQNKNPQFSPQGNKIAFMSNKSGTREIWVCEKDGGNAIRLTNFNGPRVTGPRWSPDGKWIVFDAAKKGDRDIFKIRAEGGESIQLTYNESDDSYPTWSNDGNWIYFQSHRSGNINVWKVSSAGGHPHQVTMDTGWGMFELEKGKWLYFTKWYDGQACIFKMPAKGGVESLVFKPSEFGLSTVQGFIPTKTEPFENGFYFIINSNDGNGGINFYNFETKTVQDVFDEQINEGVIMDMDISMDQKKILYSRRIQAKEHMESDICLVENWK